jgi:hypothetical protein
MKFTMNDSRPFTDYRSNCLVVNELQQKSGQKTAFDFRKYLQKNSDKIINESRMCNYKTVCPKCGKLTIQ